MNANSPIGIFDSGIGGMTVARAVKDLLPNEQIVYFGDTAHLPYGDKSAAAIQAYSIKITDVLLQKDCKVVLIACNSASAAAFELVKEYTGSRAKVFNVIDPVISQVCNRHSKAEVGLIGTKQTVNSGVYRSKLKSKCPDVILKSLATPLLVPMIEEGFIHGKISDDILSEYLTDDQLKNIRALILGCTHYPLIREEIKTYYSNHIEVIDSSTAVASQLRQFLETNNLLRTVDLSEQDQFLVSDYTEEFERTTKRFFHELVELEQYKLWE